MAELAVEARGLRKTFRGGVEALRGLDLAVRRGRVYGLIGRNGAGKTTALRLFMGLLRPSGGEALVLGRNRWTAGLEERQRCAYVSQEGRPPGKMTLEELGYSLAHFYERWDDEHARRLAGKFDLPRRRELGLMSGGEQRKAAILLALAARPEVLLLDEPAAGLDPIARRELTGALVEALDGREGLTVLLSTHILADVERLAEEVGILDRGKLVTSASLEELQEKTRRVQIIFQGDRVPEGFCLPGGLRVQAAGAVLSAVMSPYDEAALAAVREKYQARIQDFPLSLEDIFIELLGPGGPEESGRERRSSS